MKTGTGSTSAGGVPATYTPGDIGRELFNAFNFANVGPTSPLVPSYQQSIAAAQGTPMPRMGFLGRVGFPNSGQFANTANPVANLGMSNATPLQTIGQSLNLSPVTGQGPVQGFLNLLGDVGKGLGYAANPLSLIGGIGRALSAINAKRQLDAPGTNSANANQYTNAFGTPTNNNRSALGALGLMGTGWGSVGATGRGTGAAGNGTAIGGTGGFGGTGLGASFNSGAGFGTPNGVPVGTMGGGWGGGGVGSDNLGGGNWSSFGSGAAGDVRSGAGGGSSGGGGYGGGYAGGSGFGGGGLNSVSMSSPYASSTTNIGSILSQLGGGGGANSHPFNYAVK